MTDPAHRSGRTKTQKIGLALGPILFGLALCLDLDPSRPVVPRMAAVAALMAVWWITEAIPISATALLPMVLFPLLGILKAGTTAPIYFNSLIFLFIGGFIIALAMEKWGLHKRVALWIIRLIGGGPSRIILGFMAASAFLSMWISNTATAIMMLPIGLAIIYRMESDFDAETTHRFAVALLLGIAYACSLGGIATIVGTPPNLSFVRIFKITFPDADPVSFGQWFIMGLPLSVGMLLITWFMLTRVIYRPPRRLGVERSILEDQYRALGPMNFEEKVVLTVFAATALLWVFRQELVLGPVVIPGWSSLLPYPDMIDDGSVALGMVLILFLFPSKSPEARSPAIIDVDEIKKLPWDIVLLFGGGFALAKGFQVTGLSLLIGKKFSGLTGVSPFLMVVLICLTITFLTELTSNTATAEMFLPILACVAVGMNIHPLMLMIPATLSASCAFMMPVATPPNAIVFGGSRLKISEMARAGLVLNLIGVALIALFFYFVGTVIFSVDPHVLPCWANF
jgi:solute carrier family 13 (sodium-dependent dicarboxylate transporter), member 2/3/5